MTETETPKKSRWDRFTKWVTHRTPQSVVQETNRFKKFGLVKYPQTHDRHLRMFYMMDLLEEMEKELVEMATLSDAEQYKKKGLHIRKLHRAFMTVGSPWFRGLDNTTLAEKQNIAFKLEMMIGHLPSFYPDLKYVFEMLIGYSWQKLDVTPQDPIMFESRAMTKEETARVELGSEVKTY